MANTIIWKHRKKNADNKANHARVLDQGAFRKWKYDEVPISDVVNLRQVVGTYYTIVDSEIVERDISADILYCAFEGYSEGDFGSKIVAIDSRDGSVFWIFGIYRVIVDNKTYYKVTDKDGATVDSGELAIGAFGAWDVHVSGAQMISLYFQDTSILVAYYGLKFRSSGSGYNKTTGYQSLQINPVTGALSTTAYQTFTNGAGAGAISLISHRVHDAGKAMWFFCGSVFDGLGAKPFDVWSKIYSQTGGTYETAWNDTSYGSDLTDFCIGTTYAAGSFREKVTENWKFGIWNPADITVPVFSDAGTGDMGQGCATYYDTVATEDWFYVIDGSTLKSYNSAGLRWSFGLPASRPISLFRGSKNFAVWEHDDAGTKTPVIVGICGNYLFQHPDSNIGVAYDWSILFTSEIGSPIVDSAGNITLVVGNELRGYDNEGNLLWSLPDSDNFPYISNYITISSGTNDELFVPGEILGCYTQVDPDTFEVELTDPENEDTDVSIDQVVSITFSSELNTDTVTNASVTITDEDDNEYNYNWEYDDAENILTLTLNSQYPTNEEMSVTLSTSLHNTNGVYLTEIYIVKFTTEIKTFPPGPVPPAPQQVTAPALISPDTCRAENTLLTFKLTSPSIPDSKYLLHLEVFTYSDALGNNEIDSKDTVNNKEEFAWSYDNVTWIPFPEDGFGPGQTSGYFRVVMNVGRSTIVYYKTRIGADPA